MVLADLGRKLNAALSSLNRASVVDEKVQTISLVPLMIAGVLTMRIGPRRTPQRSMRRPSRDGRQCQARSFAASESKGQGQELVRRRCG